MRATIQGRAKSHKACNHLLSTEVHLVYIVVTDALPILGLVYQFAKQYFLRNNFMKLGPGWASTKLPSGRSWNNGDMGGGA